MFFKLKWFQGVAKRKERRINTTSGFSPEMESTAFSLPQLDPVKRLQDKGPKCPNTRPK